MDKQRQLYHVIIYGDNYGLEAPVIAEADVSERSDRHAASSLLGHISPFQIVITISGDGKLLYPLYPKTGHREKWTTNLWLRPPVVLAQLLRTLPTRYRSSF